MTPTINSASKARLILTDFAGSLLMALTIGVVISVVLAAAVVLIAQQSGAQSQPQTQVPGGSTVESANAP